MKKTILTTLIAVLLVVLLIALNSQMRRAAAAELALTEETLSAVAEASAELAKLTLNLEKLLVSASAEQAAAFLTDISLGADRVQRCISDLPDMQGERAAILSFLSGVSTRAGARLTRLASGDTLHTGDQAALQNDLNSLRMLQAELSLAQQGLQSGEKLGDALPATEVTAAPSAKELAEYRALPKEEVGSGKALQIAKEFVGVERVTSVSHAPDTTGALPAFGVTVQTRDVQLNLEVTRQGGRVLLMVPETAAFPAVKSVDECRAAALAFLAARGFPSMEPMYYQVYDGLCVLTCVWVEQGVIIWPDRVTVQVRMDTAEVVGIEARSFWKNHTPRRLSAPLLTEEEARAALSAHVSVESARLCLLPHERQERLCWQFTLRYEGDTYLSCIDAVTGQELLLEKVMQLDAGSIPA